MRSAPDPGDLTAVGMTPRLAAALAELRRVAAAVEVQRRRAHQGCPPARPRLRLVEEADDA
jgi:hypothetical protein